jgi:predicted DNA-binding transcriptional regulator AlpA
MTEKQIVTNPMEKASSSRVIEIGGRQYVTAHHLAATLGVSVRTLGRWVGAGIGPPRIKIGKQVLFDVAKVPEWLTTRESAVHGRQSISGGN